MTSIKIRTKPLGDGKTQLRILITHPMETGRRRDEAGRLIPAHHISDLRIKHNGRALISGTLSTAISRNPYFSFRLDGVAEGDRIQVSWVDNLGFQDSAETRINTLPHDATDL